MRIVTPRQSMRIPVEKGRNVIELDGRRQYVMHDVEAASGERAAAFAGVDDLTTLIDGPRPFDAGRDMHGDLIVPFIGGMGDAISLIPALRAIRREWPDLTVHIATTPGPGEVFALFAPVDAVRRYPLAAEQWANYDWVMTLECVEREQEPGDALAATFARSIGVELDDVPLQVELPHDAAGQLACIPGDHLLIGLATGEGDAPRVYPRSMRDGLISRLIGRGGHVVLIGETGEQPRRHRLAAVTDLRNQTPSVLELAIWLAALDVVIANDSFIMHLAGALGTPTIGLFAPSSAAHLEPYSFALALASSMSCAPCHEAGPRCPAGHERCLAWDDEALAPEIVARQAVALTRRQLVA